MPTVVLSAQAKAGIPVELSFDGYSLQYAVDAGGVMIYDTSDQGKARGVYDFLQSLPATVLAELVDYARQVRDNPDADCDRISDLEVVAGVGR